jgi:probable HAF family extracellular repeat protein
MLRSSRSVWLACYASLCFTSGVFAQSYSVMPVASSDYESQARALNNNAELTGAFRQSSGAWRAFLFNVEFVDLGALGGAQSEGLAINSANDVVGTSDTKQPGARHAFLYHSGQLIDLNSRLSEATSWVLSSAIYIGDAGQIIVSATSGNATQLFLLSPASGNACSAQGESAPCYTLSPWAGMLPPSAAAELWNRGRFLCRPEPHCFLQLVARAR